MHSGKNIHCETCDKQFTTNSNLNKHMKLHTVTITPEIKDKGNFECPKCGKECSYKRGMNEHMKKVHRFNEVICSTCDNVYKTASDLKRHINDSHAPIEKRKCSKCKKVLSSISNLKHHMMTQHIEERIHFDKNNFMVLHTEVNDEIVGSFLCTFCKTNQGTRTSV